MHNLCTDICTLYLPIYAHYMNKYMYTTCTDYSRATSSIPINNGIEWQQNECDSNHKHGTNFTLLGHKV